MRRLSADSNKCSLCGLCTLVCAQRLTGHTDLYLGAIKVDSALPSSYKTRLHYCLQCDNAHCISACPQKALTRGADNVVYLDKEACNSCKGEFLCVKACKVHGIFSDSRFPYPIKCDLCAGEKPKCISICPMKAITLK